jgi:EAL domain-containing protein (putative c-di-GMP-specific phosphodiesterase class I)
MQPRLLKLEITESILMHDTEKATEELTALCELGVKIAIDDFGTGYSSLSYLSLFPIHTLKIDKTFIHNICREGKQRRMVRAIIRMAQDMELEVIAEGVETISQLNLVEAMGCDVIQGYYYSKPYKAEKLRKWIIDR